ncbi:MAG TPA: tripartite tricarboxylate transporter substrate binding protein [Xanthobacteraceae bacterium]|nr:tripartite tricarboxylate transporter substrate binding protein [Xanthobacteraceae bacterium]
MTIARRHFIKLAAGAAALPALPRAARALDYPTRPVHIVAGYPAGAGPDVTGRLAAQWLSQRLNQQFIVDNRPGAASNIGTELVAKSAPDGYTLLVTVSTNAINATLYQNLNYNFTRDLVPVAFIGATPFVIAANPEFPAKTVPEFLDYAKANPGRINYATSGVGSGPHVSAELLKMMTGIDIVHVPYRGNYVTDVMANTIPLSFSPMPQVIEFFKDGRLRPIAVTPAKRWDDLPDVPSLGEFVPGYAASGWYSLTAPAGTPADIIARLHDEMNAGLADPILSARLLAVGVPPRPMSTAEFGQFIADEVEKWAKVIRFAQLKPA